MKKLMALLFLLALSGRLASAQGFQFTTAPASPSPTANVLSTFQFSVQIPSPWETFTFAVTTAQTGEVADAGLYIVSGGTAVLHQSTGLFSLANVTSSLPAGSIQALRTAALDTALVNSTIIFAMCSSGTSAQVMPYLYPSKFIPVPTSVNSTGLSTTFSLAWWATEWPRTNAVIAFSGSTSYYLPIFDSSWASDSSWATDAIDVCVNGNLPSTITLSNITPN